jgi:hypothetical protein
MTQGIEQRAHDFFCDTKPQIAMSGALSKTKMKSTRLFANVLKPEVTKSITATFKNEQIG